MGLKPGYKQTEVGVIPEDWDVDMLASVTPKNARNGIVDGPFGSNLKTIHYRKSGIPIITSGYVTEGRFAADSYLYVDKEKFEEEKRSAVRPGDIVMAKIGARCGASAILPHWHSVSISKAECSLFIKSLRFSWMMNVRTPPQFPHFRPIASSPDSVFGITTLRLSRSTKA